MNTSRPRRGFTLVELLIVLTIIGLLAVLLFPVFANARERASQTTCLSNMRQIGLAIHMYQGDNGGILPRQFHDVRGVSADHKLELDPLLPYEGSPDIYHCPDAPYHVGGMHGPFGEALLDYSYRVASLIDSNSGWFPSGLPNKIMRPEPMSVLASDCYHGRGAAKSWSTQTYVILRANGAVSRVPAASVALWQYVGGKWEPLPPKPTSQSQPWAVFPNEPWPPKFEK